jgi:hypothetical protein
MKNHGPATTPFQWVSLDFFDPGFLDWKEQKIKKYENKKPASRFPQISTTVTLDSSTPSV